MSIESSGDISGCDADFGRGAVWFACSGSSEMLFGVGSKGGDTIHMHEPCFTLDDNIIPSSGFVWACLAIA